MRKSIIINIILFLSLFFITNNACALPKITADAAAVIDIKSGIVVYEKNGYQRKVPASLTKMMTAILAVEYGNLAQDVTIGKKPPLIPPSKIHLRAGEKIKLDDLLKAALIKSANDATVAIAEHVAGDEAYFVYLMNLKAWSLVLQQTHYQNTNGLPARDHISSAVDLARIGLYAKSLPKINEYVAKKEETIIRRGQEQRLGNTNKLLWSYPFATGIKTGTTNAAGKCLASSASKGENQFVGVVLHSDDRYSDSIKILNYAFENYNSKLIVPYSKQLTMNNGKDRIIGHVYQDIFYPFKFKENIKIYVKSYTIDKSYRSGEKSGLLAIVTPDSILWYDIYAENNKQNLTKKLNFYDYMIKYLFD